MPSNKMRMIDPRLVAHCDTEQAAFRLCIERSRVYRSNESIADLLGVGRPNFSTAINADKGKRTRYLSRLTQTKLQLLCENTAIDQWAEMYARGELDCQREASE